MLQYPLHRKRQFIFFVTPLLFFLGACEERNQSEVAYSIIDPLKIDPSLQVPPDFYHLPGAEPEKDRNHPRVPNEKEDAKPHKPIHSQDTSHTVQRYP